MVVNLDWKVVVNLTGFSTPVTDIDGNTYPLVTICNQTWTKTNLNVSKYRNGDVIPQVTDATQWAALTTGAWCYYNNDPANGLIYGKLYNWYAVIDPRGLAPIGFHIPTDVEWTTLTTCLGGISVAGDAMKEVGTSHWSSPNSANNSSGFTGLPAGNFLNFVQVGMEFFDIGYVCCFWSSSENSTYTNMAWKLSLNYMNVYATKNSSVKVNGFSVRCIKD